MLWQFGRGKPGGLSVAATEPRRRGATRVRRGRKDPNEDIPSISLIQIFVIEISIG